jgi:hypothetical protein
MNTRRVVEDVLVPMSIVAPPPATVTQRTCLEHFGIARRDFLKFAAEGAFPVSVKGKLRIARYGDVESFLMNGATTRATPRRKHQKKDAPSTLEPSDSIAGFDAAAALRKAGFRTRD